MHLQHKIPWKELVDCLRTDPTEILLPVGKCGRIHLIDKRTKLKVSPRKFLANQICMASNCETSENPQSFSKNKLSPPDLSLGWRRRTGWRTRKLKYIDDKFYETVMEFVASEERKYDVVMPLSKDILLEEELLDAECFECYQHPCKNVCKNFVVFSLYSSYQIEKLLWLDSIGKVDVGEALCRNYGGQAVGNGYAFLVIWRLLYFYLHSNAIIACGYEKDEQKWGYLQPKSNFRQFILHDCDFLTFIPTLRPYLHEDVYMKDMEKTMELLRLVFRHIYVYVYLLKRFNSDRFDWLRRDLKVSRMFGFRDLD